MKIKYLIYYVVGAFICSLIVVGVGMTFYKYSQNKYKEELENKIDEEYLEGYSKIITTLVTSDSISLNKVEDYIDEKYGVWMPNIYINLNTFSHWCGITADNYDIIGDLVNKKNNKYFGKISNCYPAFLLALEKTSRGYIIYGEQCIGIGISNHLPGYPVDIRIEHRVFPDSIKERYKKEENPLLKALLDAPIYYIKTDNNIIHDYEKYILNEKFEGFVVRNYIVTDGFGHTKNNKMEMINKLLMKDICKGDESLFFRTNPYFELKFDEYYRAIGSDPLLSYSHTYGNDYRKLYIRSWEAHFSIQENSKLKDEIVDIFKYILCGVLAIYSIAFFIWIKQRV